ncbi:MAG TPA: DUF1501 domain-containing protein [Verrucomicrobiales bacterium]|nr:DUF1501 domain-containing protein [Verrucomicrobiales bacterium]
MKRLPENKSVTNDFPNRRIETRRGFLGSMSCGIAGIALTHLIGSGSGTHAADTSLSGRVSFPGRPAKAKRVIHLFQSGGPSQLDLYDPKPQLKNQHGKELPASVRKGQRVTTMTSGQESFPTASSYFDFTRHGQSGGEFSEAIPHIGSIADDICVIRSMHTDAINHDPAITFFQTGFQLAGNPSLGSWLSYGLGTDNEDLPAFIAMVSHRGGQPLYDRLWGSGFLPTRHQGVKFRSQGDPVLYLNNPPGIDSSLRRHMLDQIAGLNRQGFARDQDPEILTRIAQYELAFRMQTSVPDLTDVSGEPESTFRLYGEDARKPGTFAHNCLLARRMTERGVRLVQLFHRGWDHHSGLPKNLRARTAQTDQASSALVLDLKQRGLLDDTLVIWGGEFGRTVYCQGKLTPKVYGRDHHPRCFSVWLAGGGIKPGMIYGKTDDYSYNVAENPVSVHDLHATILHLLGIDHHKLTFKFKGRHFRLTDVEGNVLDRILG